MKIAITEEISLTPCCFRINHKVNEHDYYIEKRVVLSGTKWLIRYGTASNPIFVAGKGKLQNWHEGFDTPEDALDAWKSWYLPIGEEK